jgi:transcriptional regulator with PAS, ATPase and Fis domain
VDENAPRELTARAYGRKTARVTAADAVDETDGATGGAGLVGISPAIRRLHAEIRALGRGGFRAVLVQGESGVGKEVVAETLRRASPRASAPFEIYDCPAVPEDHLESELFGTARGAFPGALDKRGVLERGHGGTVFFDEIAAMRREHQAKVLRVIEGKSFRRVGGSRGIAVDVAVIAAAHEDLAGLARDGAFRHDLYYRLIRDGCLLIPPLRERPEDVPLLTRQYLASVAGGDQLHIDPPALAALADYHWPGNVRQLQTALRIALRLQPAALDVPTVAEVLARFEHRASPPAPPRVATGMVAESRVSTPDPDGTSPHDFHAITARTQRRLLLEAFEAAAGNKTAAGVLLGFHLSPGEPRPSLAPIDEGRRNLALRKFRYWCARLGIAETLAARRVSVPPPRCGLTALDEGT